MDGPEAFTINGDIHMLQRLIANILDNSLKYSPEESQIEISFKENNQYITLFFKDTGIGIAEEELPQVFKRFYRCDKSRSMPGAGLGLSLAYAIVQAHKGEISVKNRQKKGTVFTVVLPVPHK